MTEPVDRDEDELDEDEEEEEESPPPARVKAKAAASKAASAKGEAAKSGMVPSSTAIAIGVAALVLGGIGGWVAQIQKTKAAIRAEVAAAPAGSGVPAGPCGAFQTQVCKGAGDQSAACQQAKGAADILLPSTCENAIAAMPETLAKIKAGRATCDKLVSKLCADLPPGSKTCDMVKERTPSFPRERCDQMLSSYDKVIAELKQMDSGGGPQMGGMPRMGGMPGMPPGMRPASGGPPGAAPGAPVGMPHITLPPQNASAPAPAHS